MITFLENMVDKVRNDFNFWDLALLKSYGAIPGLILGAFFPLFVKQYLWIFIIFWSILFVRYVYVLFLTPRREQSLDY